MHFRLILLFLSTFHVIVRYFKQKSVIIFQLKEYNVYICTRIQLVTVSVYIINCGDLYSHSPKYVHKDFTRL